MGRVPRVSGPLGLLLLLFGLFTAALHAVRSFMVRRMRTCECCKGYGIVRCKLCGGEGKIDWGAKFAYKEGCPMCMAKRYVDCPECGGVIKRVLFPSLGEKKKDTDNLPFFTKKQA